MQLRRLVQLVQALSTVVLVVLTIGGRCSAQAQLGDQNQAAAQIINDALTAMGGAAAWSGIADATVIGNCVSALVGDDQTPIPFAWTTAQNEFRYESGAEGDSTLLLSGHGKPQALDEQGPLSLTHESFALTQPYHLPGQVLTAVLSDNRFRISMIGNEDLNGVAAVHIQVHHELLHSDEPGSEQDWWFDPTSHLPVKVTFNLPGQEIRAYLPLTYFFLAWKSELGVIVPKAISETMYPNISLKTCTVSQLKVNTQPSPGRFDGR